MRSWAFWKRGIKTRLLLGPDDDGIGDYPVDRRARYSFQRKGVKGRWRQGRAKA